MLDVPRTACVEETDFAESVSRMDSVLIVCVGDTSLVVSGVLPGEKADIIRFESMPLPLLTDSVVWMTES